QALDRLGEFGHIVAGGRPTQVAAVLAAAGIDGVFFRVGIESDLLGLDGGGDVFSGFLLFDEDVPDLVFLLVGLGCLDLVVFGLDLGVGDRVLLDVVVHEGTDQYALTRKLDILLDGGLLIEAGFFG